MKIIRQLKQTETSAESLLDLLAEGVVYFSAEGKIEKLNSAARKILRIDDKLNTFRYKSPEWMLFDPGCLTLYPDETLMPAEERAVVRALKEHMTVRNSEMGLKFPDGKVVWLDTSAFPILGDKSTIQGIVYTFVDITEQKRLSSEKMQFTQQIVRVQEEERKRISRELHDDTAQYLALLNLEINAIIEKYDGLPEGVKLKMQNLRLSAEKAFQEVRRFSHELRPHVLEQFGLSAALELLLTEFNTLCSSKAVLTLSGTEIRLSDDIELAFFRITQEALNNVRKHSGASKIDLKLKYDRGKIRITIQDNGCGFNYTNYRENATKVGLGIIGMRERAQIIGARLIIKSRQGFGTTVTAEIEIKRPTTQGKPSPL
jgi:two-component system, NarL family, sensor histidine kinase DegS